MQRHLAPWAPPVAATLLVAMQAGAFQPSVMDPPGTPGEDGRSSERDGLLRGPSIDDGAAPTIVEFDFEGRLIAVQGRPELAALRALNLDGERMGQAEAIVRDRVRALELLLVERIDDVREITDLIGAGDREGARRQAMSLREAFEPGAPIAPLIEPLRELLSEGEAAELERMVEEYWMERVRRELRDRMDPTPEERERVQARLSFELFQAEVGEAYRSSLQPYRERLERLYAATDATPAQRERLRSAVIEHIRATRLEPTPEDRANLARAVYDVLDEAQRVRVLELVISGL